MAPMSKVSVIPPAKERDLQAEADRARREKRTGCVTVTLRFVRGTLVKVGVSPNFEDDVRGEFPRPIDFTAEREAEELGLAEETP
jgi:hypothetical protein